MQPFSQTSTHPEAAIVVTQPVKEKPWSHHHSGIWKQKDSSETQAQPTSSLGPLFSLDLGLGLGQGGNPALPLPLALLGKIPS